MNELLNKISSYNIFNYLFPGFIYAIFISNFTKYNLIQSNIIINLFFLYFIGLIISRVGSIIIEPLFKKLKWLTFAEYSSFIEAVKKDEKINLLSEVNNMYRSIVSMLIIISLTILYEYLQNKILFIDEYNEIIIIFIMLILFIFSYIKQTAYVKKRINIVNGEKENE